MPFVMKRRIKQKLVITTPTGERLDIWVETLSKAQNKVRIVLDDRTDSKFFNIAREELLDARCQTPTNAEDASDDAYERLAERHEGQERLADL